MDQTTANVVGIVSALGGGTVVTLLVQAIIRGVTGRAGRELSAVEYERKLRREAEKRADEAERALDHEATARRKQAEYSSTLRRQMIEHGIPIREIPEWPVDAATMPRAEARRLVQEANDPRFRKRTS